MGFRARLYRSWVTCRRGGNQHHCHANTASVVFFSRRVRFSSSDEILTFLCWPGLDRDGKHLHLHARTKCMRVSSSSSPFFFLGGGGGGGGGSR